MSVTPFFPPKKSKPIKKANTNPAGLVSTRLMTPLRTTKSSTKTLRRLASMAADQDKERLEELEGKYVLLAEEHHEEFVFRKAAEAELTAAKAEIARLVASVGEHVTARSELRGQLLSAEADAARYRSALELIREGSFNCAHHQRAMAMQGVARQALQPHKETK